MGSSETMTVDGVHPLTTPMQVSRTYTPPLGGDPGTRFVASEVKTTNRPVPLNMCGLEGRGPEAALAGLPSEVTEAVTVEGEQLATVPDSVRQVSRKYKLLVSATLLGAS